MARASLNARDPDAEVAFNAEFLFPVSFPFFFRVLFQNDHFRQLGDGGIEPAPGYAFYAPADFPEDPFQQSNRSLAAVETR